jgi:hypothetical protein
MRHRIGACRILHFVFDKSSGCHSQYAWRDRHRKLLAELSQSGMQCPAFFGPRGDPASTAAMMQIHLVTLRRARADDREG